MIGAPLLGILLASALIFVGILIFYLCLAGASIVTVVVVAAIQLFMAIIAVFWPFIWQVMLDMWLLLWNLLVNMAVPPWPYFKGAILPLLISLIILQILHNAIRRLNKLLET
jgi:hypothetical protein